MCACVGNHCFNSTFQWKTYIDAYLSSIQFWLKSLHLISLWISLLNCCYSIHKDLNISEHLETSHNSLAASGASYSPLTHLESRAGQTEVGVPGENLTFQPAAERTWHVPGRFPLTSGASLRSVSRKSPQELSVTAKKQFWASLQPCCLFCWTPAEQLIAWSLPEQPPGPEEGQEGTASSRARGLLDGI